MKPKAESDHIAETRAAVVAAARPHVAFDGWSRTVLAEAVAEAGVDAGLAAQAFPRGPVDLALAFHRAGDEALEARLTPEALAGKKIREKIAFAVRTRLEIAEPDREAVRRAVAFFALPMHAADGTAATWGTVDLMWRGIGDTSEDFNWYSKRAILFGVYSSTLLYWLGDESPGRATTWEFLDRRIENVMDFEKFKARMRENRFAQGLMRGPLAILDRIRAPGQGAPEDLPGQTRR